jgi:hypothetical protein
MHAGLSENLTLTDSFSQKSLPDSYPFFYVLVHFLSFLLKMTVAFAAYATAKKRPFSQKLLGSAAVFLRLYTHRGFAPPFTVTDLLADIIGFITVLFFFICFKNTKGQSVSM